MKLIESVEEGDIEAVKQFIAAGADVNAKDEEGVTPLHQAATHVHYGRKEIVELLIAEGADVNPKGWNGGTPLHLAAWGREKEIVELLIAKGADVNAKNVDGRTPLDWTSRETADLIRKHGGKAGAKLKRYI